jgi:hypothetical protein
MIHIPFLIRNYIGGQIRAVWDGRYLFLYFTLIGFLIYLINDGYHNVFCKITGYFF